MANSTTIGTSARYSKTQIVCNIYLPQSSYIGVVLKINIVGLQEMYIY